VKCPWCIDHNGSIFIKYKLDIKNFDLSVKCTSTANIDEKPTLYKCNKCKLIFSEYVEKKFEELYSEVADDLYIDQIPFKERYFQNTLKKISHHLDKSRTILEIGSYYGVFGSLIKPLVKKYEGLELSSHAAKYASKNYSLNIKNQTINEYLLDNEKLDIVIMSHVIEHLDDPFDVVKKIENKMTDESLLIFSTYNMDSLIAKILGKHYHWIMPMHKFYFTKNTLNKLMQENGLQIFDIKTDTHTISLKYFLIKIKGIFPILRFFIDPLLNKSWSNKINLKINLGDLDIYFVKKKLK